MTRVINFQRAARIIEFGSAPHEIKTRTKRILKFFKEGPTKFRNSVVHLGIRPLFIMLDSALRTVPFFEEQCNKLWKTFKNG